MCRPHEPTFLEVGYYITSVKSSKYTREVTGELVRVVVRKCLGVWQCRSVILLTNQKIVRLNGPNVVIKMGIWLNWVFPVDAHAPAGIVFVFQTPEVCAMECAVQSLSYLSVYVVSAPSNVYAFVSEADLVVWSSVPDIVECAAAGIPTLLVAKMDSGFSILQVLQRFGAILQQNCRTICLVSIYSSCEAWTIVKSGRF